MVSGNNGDVFVVFNLFTKVDFLVVIGSKALSIFEDQFITKLKIEIPRTLQFCVGSHNCGTYNQKKPKNSVRYNLIEYFTWGSNFEMFHYNLALKLRLHFYHNAQELSLNCLPVKLFECPAQIFLSSNISLCSGN